MSPSGSRASLDQTDLILVLLAAETRDPRQRFRCDGITRLEKLVFLLRHEPQYASFDDEVAEPFAFEPYHYGPYSKQIYDAVALLGALKLLRERRVSVSTGIDQDEEAEAFGLFPEDEAEYVERQMSLTDDGKAVAKLLSTRLSPEAKTMLSDLKDRFGRMPLRQLLRYVYTAHPAYAAKSRIRSQF